jgi:streptogramin lyase
LVVVAALTAAATADGQCVTEFAPSALSFPSNITAGPDGNMWFSEFDPGNIGRILVAAPNTITEFNVSMADIRPAGITAGPDGNLWFVEITGNNVGRIAPASPNTITEFPIPTADSDPQDIVTGPDGNLWFTQGDGQIGRIIPGSPNTITEFNVPSGFGSNGIAAGPDGNLWFADTFNTMGNEGGDKVGRILPNPPHTITEFTIPTAFGSPADITTGPDGNLWFTELLGDRIGRITPDAPNTITEFPLPTANSRAGGIVAGPDGNIWFAESGAQKIGRIMPNSPNTITEFTVGAGDITNGPDGNLWYTAIQQVVGRLSLTGCQDCVAAKLKSIRKNEKGRFTCLAKVAKTGDASGLSDCVAKVDAKFADKFADAGSCGSAQALCASRIDVCVANVTGFLPNTTGKCEAAKLTATGKLAAALINCAAKSAKRDKPQDPNCAIKARQKFFTALIKADESGPCPGPGMFPDTVIAAAVELFCVSGIPASDSSGRVMAAICR